MLSLLRTPRWLGFTVFALVVVAGCVRLGIWQYHRGEGRSHYNGMLSARAHEKPVELGSLTGVHTRPDDDLQYRRVTATGRYLADSTLLVRNQVVDSRVGYDALVPLQTADGVLLVNRGWLPASDRSTETVSVPAPPAGTVTVTGRIRLPQGSNLKLATGSQPSVGRIVPSAVAGFLERDDVYRVYVEATAESPEPAQALRAPGEPDGENQGMNYAYFVQWELFAVIGVVGWFILLRREAADQRAAGATPPRP